VKPRGGQHNEMPLFRVAVRRSKKFGLQFIVKNL